MALVIGYGLIVEAAGFSSAVVLLAVGLAHWRPLPAFAATVGTFGFLVPLGGSTGRLYPGPGFPRRAPGT